MPIHASTAVLAAADIKQTVDWYQTVLGFSDPWVWGDRPGFGGIRWGEGQLMFILDPPLARSVVGHQHYFNTDEVDVLYHRHVSAGAVVVSALAEMPWGVWEYTLRDPNGYYLRFGGSLAAKSARENRASPAGICLERRLPSVDEYLALRREVGWEEVDSRDAAEILGRCLYSVIAKYGGEMVAMAFAVGDGRQHIYIQDVAVCPRWQKQGVGSLLMSDLLAHIQEIAPPGCWVSLFCVPSRNSFYGRLGFRAGHGLAMRVQRRD